MEKTAAQKIAELTKRVEQLTTLRDVGMCCQLPLDQVLTDRDELVRKEKEHARSSNSGG